MAEWQSGMYTRKALACELRAWTVMLVTVHLIDGLNEGWLMRIINHVWICSMLQQ